MQWTAIYRHDFLVIYTVYWNDSNGGNGIPGGIEHICGFLDPVPTICGGPDTTLPNRMLEWVVLAVVPSCF